MCKILEKKAALEADLETLLGIENPSTSQSEKIERINVVLGYIQHCITKHLGVDA